MRIRANDTVLVLTGGDKGTRARVLRVDRAAGKVVVEGVNKVTKLVRRSQKNPQGGIVQVEKPLRASRLMVVCMHCRRPTRLKRLMLPSGDKVRVCRHCNEQLDKV